MEKDLSIGVLFDFYGSLLTEKQAMAVDYYYNQDFSLSEIAQELQVSRQGARDNIARGAEHLREWEKKLHAAERFAQVSEHVSQMERLLEQLSANIAAKMQSELWEHLRQIKELL